jgi:hypothetical protein
MGWQVRYSGGSTSTTRASQWQAGRRSRRPYPRLGPAGGAAAMPAPPLSHYGPPRPCALPGAQTRRSAPPPCSRPAKLRFRTSCGRQIPFSVQVTLTAPGSRKGERSLTAVAPTRTASPQVAIARHALPSTTRLRRLGRQTSGSSLAAVASPQVNCRIRGRNWVRTSDPSLVRRPGPNAVATSENPGHRELISLKARGH